MGAEMDDWGEDVSLETCGFCSSVGDILFRVVLCDILAQEEIIDAGTNFFERADFERRGSAHGLRLSFVQFDEEQAQTRENKIDHRRSS